MNMDNDELLALTLFILFSFLGGYLIGFQKGRIFEQLKSNKILSRLRVSKCEHGKDLSDYCQPCGRIHSE